MTNELAQKLTQAINAGATIEESLSNCFTALSRCFPLDIMTFSSNNHEKGLLRYIAHVTKDMVLFVDEKIQLSQSAIDEGRKTQFDRIKFFDENSPLLKDVAERFELSNEVSNIVQTMLINPPETFGIGMTVFDKGRYTREHAALFESLHAPLSTLMHNLALHRQVASQNEKLAAANKEFSRRLGYLVGEQIIGAKSGLKDVMNMAMKVAPLDSPVLIMGETGSGKEVIANAIHRASTRADGPFISVNCGAIPDALIDSQLFGHEKGAFTGATSLKRGFFEQADGGAIFLDEIGELPLQAQVRLLRVLQNMEFQRVGGNKYISLDVRVIAATNRNLQEMVNKGEFREDLWFRLNVFPIWLPPLRQRKADIPALAAYFALRKTREMNLPDKPRFGSNAMQRLQGYDWPGNVRELQNVIERELIISQQEPLSFYSLETSSRSLEVKRDLEPINALQPLDDVISGHIRKALQISNGKINGPGGAADLLQINPSTLRGKMKKLGIRIIHGISG